MKVFCIDPFLLAYPRFEENTDNCAEEFINYINTLIEWGDFIDGNGDAEDIYVSFLTDQVLAEVNGFPEWGELEKTITHVNLDKTIQVHDIHSIIYRILKLPSIEEKININEILFDFQNVECSISNYLLTRGTFLQEHFYRIAILECLIEKLIYKERINKLLITRCHQHSSQIISFKSEILDHEPIRESPIFNLDKPDLVGGDLIFCTDPEYISNLYNSVLEQVVELWKNSTSEQVYNEAVMKYANDANSQLEQPKLLLAWSFGRKFLETLKKLGFDKENKKIEILLRSCAETILEENLKDTHHLRTGKSGNSSQRERQKDKAKAWRRDIDYEYHLHYWKTLDNKIEFASVVTHNDMKIPE